jgi:hypothetical protein
MTVATLSAETILPATLERAACQPLLNAALEDAAVNKPLLFFFLRELIWCDSVPRKRSLATAPGPPAACQRPFRFGRDSHRGRPFVCVRACMARRRKIRFRCAGGGSRPPPIGPEIHPNCPSKQGTKHERNNLAARSVLTWYSSSQYPNYAVDFRPCRTSTPVPVTSYRSYPPAFHSLKGRSK